MKWENLKTWSIVMILGLPLFFIYYRQLAFFTINFDNYYDYVLWLNGVDIQPAFINPTAYRFLSYGIIALVYKLLPLIVFSGFSPDVPATMYKALQAQAFTAYVFQMALLWLSYRYVLVRMQLNKSTAMLTAVVTLGLSHFTAFSGLDACMMWYTLLVLYHRDHRLLFPGLLLLSPIVNEKISLYLVIFFGAELAWSVLNRQQQRWRYFIWPMVAFGLFILLRQLWHLPGYDEQRSLAGLAGRMWSGVKVFFHPKGLYLNLLPLLLLLTSLWWAIKAGLSKKLIGPPLSYLALLGALILIGLAVNYDFTIGRTIMLSLPFFVPVIAVNLAQWASDE